MSSSIPPGQGPAGGAVGFPSLISPTGNRVNVRTNNSQHRQQVVAPPAIPPALAPVNGNNAHLNDAPVNNNNVGDAANAHENANEGAAANDNVNPPPEEDGVADAAGADDNGVEVRNDFASINVCTMCQMPPSVAVTLGRQRFLW